MIQFRLALLVHVVWLVIISHKSDSAQASPLRHIYQAQVWTLFCKIYKCLLVVHRCF